MKYFDVGTRLLVDNKVYTVIGCISFENTSTGEQWFEYKLNSDKNQEFWLSMDEENDEYVLSWECDFMEEKVDPEWHLVEDGHQRVIFPIGDVDVDYNEISIFVEYEDESQEKTLSEEVWEDESEFSQGYYLDRNEIKVIGYKKEEYVKHVTHKEIKTRFKSIGMSILVFIASIIALLPEVYIESFFEGDSSYADDFFSMTHSAPIEDYLKHSKDYKYITSITGAESEKAQVYEALIDPSKLKINDPNIEDAEMDYVAKDIIYNIYGETESVSINKDENGVSIGIISPEESCLLYHPDGEPFTVYIEVSKRKYVYASNNRPYHSHMSTYLWYRNFYYTTGYHTDSARWSSIPSTYTKSNATTVKDLGNGYYDVYSRDIKQSSAGRRNSQGGSHGRGK